MRGPFHSNNAGRRPRVIEACLLLGFASLISYFPIPSAIAKDPVPVPIAVLDTPIDLEHELLSPFIDSETMRRLKARDSQGRTLSWAEANAQAKKELERRLRAGHYQEHLAYIDAVNRLSDDSRRLKPAEREQVEAIVRRGEEKYRNSALWRKELDIISEYQHGTHVAGLIVRSASPLQVKLISYPFLGSYDRKPPSLKDLRKPEAYLRNLSETARRITDTVSQGIQQAGVKIVNFSGGYSKKLAIEGAQAGSYWARQPEYDESLEKIAEEEARLTQAEQLRLINENPDVVFVSAAGNQGINLDTTASGEWHTARIRAKNLITVGSLNRWNDLDLMSNFGKRFVDVAALGTNVPSARAGGGIVYKSGTSMAVPLISDQIARIRHEHPEWSAERAIREFLNRHTQADPNLAQQVRGGRYLPIDENSSQPPQTASKSSMTPEACSRAYQKVLRTFWLRGAS